jgi:hypothetical protein
MNDEAFLPAEILGHGAYVCVRAADPRGAREAGARLPALAERLGLRNEFDGAPPGRESIAWVRRIGATPADVADEGVLAADALVHVAATDRTPVDEFCEAAAEALASAARVRVLRGVSRPRSYTGAAMDNWAYARQVVQQPAAAMPHAFFVPMSKTAEWWDKGWMERHTYFLPRYDDQGRMLTEGHALATEAGIAHLLRRTYRAERQPAPPGRVRLPHLLRVRRGVRARLPPGVRRPARRRAQPRVALRPRGPHLARPPRRRLGGPLHGVARPTSRARR